MAVRRRKSSTTDADTGALPTQPVSASDTVPTRGAGRKRRVTVAASQTYSPTSDKVDAPQVEVTDLVLPDVTRPAESKRVVRYVSGVAQEFSQDLEEFLARDVEPIWLPSRPEEEGRRLERVKDVVCGMTIDPERAAGVLDYRGKKYHFCSKGCVVKFEADAEKYLDPNYKPGGMGRGPVTITAAPSAAIL